MTERIAIDFDVIQQHATRVDQVASDIRQAEQAAGSMNMGGGAFGLMCAFLVPVASMVSSMATNAISSAADLVTRSATEIRAVGQDFAALEDELSASVRPYESAADSVSL